jgi:hypothetical protein
MIFKGILLSTLKIADQVHANDFSGMFASTTLRRIAMTLNFKECFIKDWKAVHGKRQKTT